MKKEGLSREEYSKLLDFICKELMKSGFKGTTMDSLASSLQMSKRTLYEIFGDKQTMFQEARNYFHGKMENTFKDFFCNSGNIMEAILKSFNFNRNLIAGLSKEFIRDLNEMAEKNPSAEEGKKQVFEMLHTILMRGVREGYFREDVNLLIQCRMLSIQMESLKRMEELFPPDITLQEVYESIMVGFLTGISTPKGQELLQQTIKQLKNRDNNN